MLSSNKDVIMNAIHIFINFLLEISPYILNCFKFLLKVNWLYQLNPSAWGHSFCLLEIKQVFQFSLSSYQFSQNVTKVNSVCFHDLTPEIRKQNHILKIVELNYLLMPLLVKIGNKNCYLLFTKFGSIYLLRWNILTDI